MVSVLDDCMYILELFSVLYLHLLCVEERHFVLAVTDFCCCGTFIICIFG